MSIDFLYAALGLALFMLALAGLLRLDARYRRWKIERRRRARGGDITEELARRVRFYDDQYAPQWTQCRCGKWHIVNVGFDGVRCDECGLELYVVRFGGPSAA